VCGAGSVSPHCSDGRPSLKLEKVGSEKVFQATAASGVPREYLASEANFDTDHCAPEAVLVSRWRDALESQSFSRRTC